ncbi:MAG: potassium-transporting ATPase subunit KdpA [Prevotella bivia]|uniref:Potassium-transporting ATPase potassium-binding subunit n=1 Tax=Prevotella bivia DSM 20514 TaxID=868129 RepID=I4Z9Z1_9BACT|nr:potassium-transporting ATPase subunit KdpA [Prevotella bivia]EFB93831.1 K+-transporting ATPase, A subunit [Prevotella bivia JCVIHMP010]EIM33033.1 K+-transporting ATPase, KdpA [Prevotella bivia DSM 20514]MDK7763870.1 potassium-transporting ATPase subunit KdpA [Prevotella bivia]MDU6555079.1 potassium-transporting ATPase subunit KdpA [Prevotella bivia]
MNTELVGVAAQIVLMVGLSYPLGKYIARVYKGEKTWLDFLRPVERMIFRLSGINPGEEMNWKQFLRALLTVNLFWFVWGMVLLVLQGSLPLNPDGNLGQTAHQAFNTCISFMVNCNLQHYSGESGLTYFTQLFVIMLFQFITAACGMAAMAGIMKALAAKTTQTIGNFWNYLVLSVTRILLPLSLIVGFILIVEGVPMGFDGKMEVTTLEGTVQQISQGPAAAIIPIKQLGTNGGGYFGVNSSHPLENPTYLTNMVECISILLIPMAMAFAFGFYLKRKRLGSVIYGVMLVGFLMGVGINVSQEMGGNSRIDAMGIAQNGGSMEGKEVRFGSAATGLWSVVTTVTSNGSVNGMHDSTMPLSGMMEMLNMQINTWFGGVGVGWMNYFTFIIMAVFISGLMVGRTPEFLGHKVEAREMKIASIVALLHPFIILVGTALAAYLFVYAPDFVASEGGWLNNPGYHGLGEILYEYTSSAANNGSGFEGLGDNTWFWNFSCGLVLILGRFVPIIGQVAIAGLLAEKRYVPESAGTLRTDTATFGVMTFAVILIIAALSFFPAQALSTIAEHFSL